MKRTYWRSVVTVQALNGTIDDGQLQGKELVPAELVTFWQHRPLVRDAEN